MPDSNDDADRYRDWSHDLTSLQNLGEELIKEWREDKPHSARAYPTTDWLDDNGWSHLRWVLRNKHQMGTREFFILLTSAGQSDEYQWLIDDVATIERVQAYLDDRVECRDWAKSTKRTHRARINQVLHRFSIEVGDDNVLALVSDASEQSKIYQAFKDVIKSLRDELSSDESVHQYLRASHRLFEWLSRHGRIESDPLEGIENEFRWDWSANPTPLTGEQVKRLWRAADTNAEKMMVVGYCIWGLRTKELPAVHVSQFSFDREDPVINFNDEERKNGQGSVTLMFGLTALAEILDKRQNQPNWNGYLYPSAEENRAYLSAEQARERFKALCDRADVTVDGSTATPKHGRSFYYNILMDAETDLLERIEQMVTEQGSADPDAVRDYYLTDERCRRYRRIFFRHRIKDILPDRAYIGDSEGYDLSLDEF